MRRGHEKDMAAVWVRPDRVSYWESGGWHKAPEKQLRAYDEMDDIRRRYYGDAVYMEKLETTKEFGEEDVG
jgi:hypothetical protein